MALSEGQVRVRNLVMGPGTPFTLFRFNPFRRRVRSDQRGPRPWSDGSWSGAEFAEEKVVPLRLIVSATDVTMASWMTLDQQLAAAFAPVGEDATDVEMAFRYGGRDYVMFGRPLGVEPDIEHVGRGWSMTETAFRCDDPLIYGADEQTGSIGLPQFEGGLTVPFTVPFTIGGVLVDGVADLLNEGTATTPMMIRIDGPVIAPRVSVQYPDGGVDTLRFALDLQPGQWLSIDTGAETVFLNDVANRMAQTSGEFPRLPPGTSRIRFASAEHNDQAELSWSYRPAWR